MTVPPVVVPALFSIEQPAADWAAVRGAIFEALIALRSHDRASPVFSDLDRFRRLPSRRTGARRSRPASAHSHTIPPVDRVRCAPAQGVLRRSAGRGMRAGHDQLAHPARRSDWRQPAMSHPTDRATLATFGRALEATVTNRDGTVLRRTVTMIGPRDRAPASPVPHDGGLARGARPRAAAKPKTHRAARGETPFA